MCPRLHCLYILNISRNGSQSASRHHVQTAHQPKASLSPNQAIVPINALASISAVSPVRSEVTGVCFCSSESPFPSVESFDLLVILPGNVVSPN